MVGPRKDDSHPAHPLLPFYLAYGFPQNPPFFGILAFSISTLSTNFTLIATKIATKFGCNFFGLFYPDNQSIEKEIFP
jgi:hypothetical protein